MKNNLVFAFLEYSKKKLKCNRSKKADSKLLSIWWFFILIVVVGGVVIAVAMFNSTKIDIRSIETEILSERVTDCILNFGKINTNFFDKDFDIFEECGISKKAVNSSGNFYLNISVKNLVNNKVDEKVYGNQAFVEECLVQQTVSEAKNFPRCNVKSIDVLGFNGELSKLNILTGSNSEYRLK